VKGWKGHEVGQMRRGIADPLHSPVLDDLGTTAVVAATAAASPGGVNTGNASRPRKTSKKALMSNKEKKCRLCYLLIFFVVTFQVIIFTSNQANQDKGLTHIPNLSSSSTSSLRGVPVAGTLNQHPIYLSSLPFHSTVHCVGETHNPETAWMYRSCEFTNLCLDVQTLDFYLVESKSHQVLHSHRIGGSYLSTELISSGDVSQENNLTLAVGGINPRWLGKDFNQGIEKVKWFPKIVTEVPTQYYMLDPSATLVPFHSLAAHNVGHMLWDDFLPIFTLLSIFGRTDLVTTRPTSDQTRNDDKLLLLRFDTLPLLYGTCEMRRKKTKKCAENFEKFLPLLHVDPNTFSTLKTLKFQPLSVDDGPTWICAKHAMAGMGMLTDHGFKDHGWRMPKETHNVQNTAKGALLYQFRNMMIQNLGLPLTPSPNDPLRIVLSTHSSADPIRDVGLTNQERALKRVISGGSIQQVELATLPMREQIQLVSQTHILISTCGGGSMTATFLPKGATLILYYDERGGYDFANNFNLTNDPAFLDWDLMNNMSYLRVHWLPIGTMNKPEGLEALVRLIQYDTEVMSNGL